MTRRLFKIIYVIRDHSQGYLNVLGWLLNSDDWFG